ncbi:hypothetical protein [Achromobacter sp. UMC46]|uniref:hypothetical protein n=1 Tax=Achromobacter sp. UMC46 TaxID=1862319 RepID=UPI00351C5738
MLLQFHHIMQHSPNDDHARLNPIDQKMPGSLHDASLSTRPFSAQPQVPGTNTGAKLWPSDAAGTFWGGGNIAHRGNK